jgi:hypothetical protein
MAGELKGAELEVVPSEMTDWKTWKNQYPGTDVLDMRRTTRAFVTEMQKQSGEFTLGLRLDGAVADYPFDVLKKEIIVVTNVGDVPVLATYDTESATARAFERKVDGKALEFELEDGVLIDTESRSIWNPATGNCKKGKYKNSKLAMLPGIPSFIKAWRMFYPGSVTHELKR